MTGRAAFFGAILVAGLKIGALQGAAYAAVTGVLPRFSDGKPSIPLAIVPGVVKRLRLQTLFSCTSESAEPVDVGVEIFDADGIPLNDVSADVGTVLEVTAGQTVTVGTSATAAFLETTTIPLADFSQGVARLVATSERVRCNVLVVDDAVSPPVSLGTLSAGVRLEEGGSRIVRELPQLPNGRRATHSAVVPGVVKRGRMETNFFCTSLAPEPVDVAVEIFGPEGDLRNDVGAGNGALLDVAPGATVTFGTTGTAAYLETTVIVIEGVSQGMARISSTSGDVVCAAQVLDSDLTPPSALSALFVTGVGADAPPTATPTPTATSTITPTATVAPTSTHTPTPRPTPQVIRGCTGDCNEDQATTLDEVVRGVNIALGRIPVDRCPRADDDQSGAVTINELVRAVTAALAGCGE